jgi:hypothetical protein
MLKDLASFSLVDGIVEYQLKNGSLVVAEHGSERRSGFSQFFAHHLQDFGNIRSGKCFDDLLLESLKIFARRQGTDRAAQILITEMQCGECECLGFVGDVGSKPRAANAEFRWPASKVRYRSRSTL